MYAGNTIVTFRLNPALLIDLDFTLVHRNQWTPGEIWDRSDFIRAAIAEKISKMKRSRERKGVRKPRAKKVKAAK